MNDAGFDAAIPSEHRPELRVIAGELDLTSTAAEEALLKSGIPIYQRGQSLVRPVLMEVTAAKGRTTIAAGLSRITVPALIDRMCRVAEWKKYDGRSKSWRNINPPPEIAATILSRVGEWKFRPVSGVTTTPTLRPDGSLLTEHGYDSATRLYHAADEKIDVRQYLSPTPTIDNAKVGLADLQHLLRNFPTVGEIDHAVALSGLITPIARGALGSVPMHAFRASTAGSGKSYLVDVASTIATGRPCPAASVSKNEEETEKRLAGLLLAAFPLVCLDNVNGELGGDLLCQAIERPIVQIRPLGSSEIIEIETRNCCYATGNALRVRGDMTRRTIVADLDAGVERPELRDFDFDPVEEVLKDRSRYVAACLNIVMAHAAAGFPGTENLPPLGSFGDWSKYVRAALIWLGCADPCRSMEAAREDDPELVELNELLDAWSQEIGNIAAITTAELIDAIAERHDDAEGRGAFKYPRLRELVLGWSGTKSPDGRKIGNVLRTKEGRISRGKRLKKAPGNHGGVVKWRVVVV